jgi:hypothetical protein
MRLPFIYSLILHLLVIVVAILGLPSLQQPPTFEQAPVVVELATVAEKANPPPAAQLAPAAEPQESAEPPARTPEPPQPRAEPKPEPRPQPQPKSEATPVRPMEPKVGKPEPSPPRPQEPAPKPEPKAETRPAHAKPEPPKPEPPKLERAEPKPEPKTVARPAPEPEPKPEPRPQIEPRPPAEQKAETARPETKPTPPPERKPDPPESPAKAAQPPKAEASKPDAQKPEFAKTERQPESASDFASVLKTVDELKQRASKGEEKPAKPEPAAPSSKARTDESDSGFTSQVAEALRSSGPAGNKPSLPVTSSEIDAVRRQIERCWNMPGGAKEAGDLVVSIRVEMNLDGTPRSAVVANSGQMQANPYRQAVADSARRAVLNPRCHPFKLPPEKYDHWRTMTLIFDPKEMS